jgi:SAM-dependent methyltransferase
MNRKERRALAKRDPGFSGSRGRADEPITDLMNEARRQYQRGNSAQAERLCRQVLTRVPTHVHSLNLMGIIAQSSGRYHLSVKMFADALASDPLNSACHYNMGSSYQALNRRDEATIHFKRAIALGLSEKNVEEFIMKNPAIATCLAQLEEERLLPRETDDLFNAAVLQTLADDMFLQSAMESVVIRGRALERFLTHLRFTLLRLAAANAAAPRAVADALISCLSALAVQCSINEYIYSQSEDETQQSIQLRDLLLDQLNVAGEIEPMTLATVAAYFSLNQLPGADKILSRDWPVTVAELIKQQLIEPLEEIGDRLAIPSLTAVDEGVSLQVMQQYEQNPYPRWTSDPHAVISMEESMQRTVLDEPFSGDILVAGCGTGRHALQVACQYPKARILAIDLSVPSLGYARRKMREAGVNNVEFAQADILKLQTLGRSFDRIEAVGVLHHLAEPEVGRCILLSLLRQGGEMRVGLYSETARRSIVEARALIAERGYRPTIDDIRKFREEIFRADVDGRWRRITSSADFYSVSGCRDLLFNAMEHRFTIPQISKYVAENGISFLGFDAEPQVIQLFQRLFPTAPPTDLQHWHALEMSNPGSFRYMYVFSVRKDIRV